MTHDLRNAITDRRVNPARRKHIARVGEDRRMAIFVRRVLLSRRSDAVHERRSQARAAPNDGQVSFELMRWQLQQ
jgi:hypothetical protein